MPTDNNTPPVLNAEQAAAVDMITRLALNYFNGVGRGADGGNNDEPGCGAVIGRAGTGKPLVIVHGRARLEARGVPVRTLGTSHRAVNIHRKLGVPREACGTVHSFCTVPLSRWKEMVRKAREAVEEYEAKCIAVGFNALPPRIFYKDVEICGDDLDVFLECAEVIQSRLDAERAVAPPRSPRRRKRELHFLSTVEVFGLDIARAIAGRWSLVVVDEASMLSRKLLLSLRLLGIPVVLVGDDSQLPVVGEPSGSGALAYVTGMQDPNAETVVLTEVYRHAGMILRAAHAIRLAKDKDGKPFTWRELMPHFSLGAMRRDVDAMVGAAGPSVTGSRWADEILAGNGVVLAYSRRAVDEINNQFRALHGRKPGVLVPGDLLTLRQTWRGERLHTAANVFNYGPAWGNCAAVRVLEVGPLHEVAQFESEPRPHSRVEMTMCNGRLRPRTRTGTRVQWARMENLDAVDEDERFRDGWIELRNYNGEDDPERDHRVARVAPGETLPAIVFGDDDEDDAPPTNLVQCSHAYASTCHRAQGGQWPLVLALDPIWSITKMLTSQHMAAQLDEEAAAVRAEHPLMNDEAVRDEAERRLPDHVREVRAQNATREEARDLCRRWVYTAITRAERVLCATSERSLVDELKAVAKRARQNPTRAA